MAFVCYPLNDVDYSAEDVAIYNCTRSSGIFAGEDFAPSVTGANNSVTVSEGLAWMRTDRFAGMAVASKSPVTVDLGLPDPVGPRIDAVCLRYTAASNGVELAVKKGPTGGIIPAPQQTASVYELYICLVRRDPGAPSVSRAAVTDVRLDPKYCGLMADAITMVDTSAIQAQTTALVVDLRRRIQQAEGGYTFAPELLLDKASGDLIPGFTIHSMTVNRMPNNLVRVDFMAICKKKQSSYIIDADKLSAKLNENFAANKQGVLPSPQKITPVGGGYFSTITDNAPGSAGFFARALPGRPSVPGPPTRQWQFLWPELQSHDMGLPLSRPPHPESDMPGMRVVGTCYGEVE